MLKVRFPRMKKGIKEKEKRKKERKRKKEAKASKNVILLSHLYERKKIPRKKAENPLFFSLSFFPLHFLFELGDLA